MKEIRAYRRPYIAFGIVFGAPFVLSFVSLYYIRGLSIALELSSLGFVMLFIAYSWLTICKISYDDEQISYRGIFGTTTVYIKDIKKYQIKTEIHSNPFRPMFGLFIDTVQKKSEIIIPANIFAANELNELMDHIDNINGSSKGKSRAGKSVFKYSIN